MASLSSRPKIAYVMSRFPHLPETFILREMEELRRLGWQISLYPLIRQQQSTVHPEAQAWVQKMHYTPFFSAGVLAQNTSQTLRQPAEVLGLWKDVLQGNWASKKFLARAAMLMPKAVYTARQMQAEGIEHIHAHYATHPALFAWLIHRLTGISYSLTVHAHDIFVDTTMLEPKVREAAFVAAISEYNRRYLASILGPWVLEKTHLVHCGVEPERYPPHKPYQSGPLEIVNVGSLQTYKGQRWLVEACEILCQMGVPFHCRIAGEGEERANLETLIRQKGLEQQVELLGGLPQDEVARLLTSADCYVQPSVVDPDGKMEGIPVAIMEALASGLPVVATRISGVPELVIDGQTGLLVPPEDAQALAQALSRVYYEPDFANQLGRNGIFLVTESFNLKKNVEILSGLFERVTRGEAVPAEVSTA